MRVIETKYPGLIDMLKHTGLSVQGQERYPLRISIDQHGEQTINRDAKTIGISQIQHFLNLDNLNCMYTSQKTGDS